METRKAGNKRKREKRSVLQKAKVETRELQSCSTAVDSDYVLDDKAADGRCADLRAALRLEHETRMQLCRRLREQHQTLAQGSSTAAEGVTMQVKEDSGVHHVLSWGLIVADKQCCYESALEAELVVRRWASRVCCLDLDVNTSDVVAWLANELPFCWEHRKNLAEETGLVAWAGHVDQTGVEEGCVRVVLDDFVRAHAPVGVVNVLRDASEEQLVQGRVASRFEYPSGRGGSIVAWKTCGHGEQHDGDGASRPPELGWQPSSNLVLAGLRMPGRQRARTLGPVVEVVTSFEGWSVAVCFVPREQAHGNALFGLHDKYCCSTVRVVPFVGNREAQTVRKEEALLCCDWKKLHASSVFVEAQEDSVHWEVRSALSEVVHAFTSSRRTQHGCDSLVTSDGWTGGDVISLGYRGRVMPGEEALVSQVDVGQDRVWPLQPRAIHARGGEEVLKITRTLAPLLGMAADAIFAAFPRTYMDMEGGIYTAGVDRRFPPHVAQVGGRVDGKSIPCTQVVVRLNHVPETREELSEDAVAEIMAQACGMHNDDADASVTEAIIYSATLHSRETCVSLTRLVMQMRLRGGAMVTRARSHRHTR